MSHFLGQITTVKFQEKAFGKETTLLGFYWDKDSSSIGWPRTCYVVRIWTTPSGSSSGITDVHNYSLLNMSWKRSWVEFAQWRIKERQRGRKGCAQPGTGWQCILENLHQEASNLHWIQLLTRWDEMLSKLELKLSCLSRPHQKRARFSESFANLNEHSPRAPLGIDCGLGICWLEFSEFSPWKHELVNRNGNSECECPGFFHLSMAFRGALRKVAQGWRSLF